MNKMRKMTFEISNAVSKTEMWKEYLDRNLHIGIELELERGTSAGSERSIFGVPHTDYHEYVSCDQCNVRSTCRGHNNGGQNEEECHKWFRENLVIAIQTDGSLGGSGSEFLLHTGNLATEEFMNRIPINKMLENGYCGTGHGSIHCHLLIPYFKKRIPRVIFENTWNLFRYYYVGMAYLTGATARTCTRRTDYCHFNGYDQDFKEHERCGNRDMWWISCRDEDDKITDFNIEIRMFDDSVNVKHIALCRIISKLLLLRGAELAVFGRWMMRKDEEWNKRRSIIVNILNRHMTVNSDNCNVMKNNAKELYLEMEHLMTDKERSIFMELLRRPLWKGGQRSEPIRQEQEGFDELECLIVAKSVIANNRMEYYNTVAAVLQTTPDMVRERLSKMGAKWNKKLGLYSLK